MNRKRNRLVLMSVLLAALCLSVFTNLRPGDTYARRIDVFAPDFALRAAGIDTAIAPDETDYVGVAFKSRPLSLPAGEYMIRVNCPSSTPYNQMDLYSAAYVSADNGAGRVFAQQPLETGETTFIVYLPRAVEDLELRLIYVGGALGVNYVEITGTRPYLADSFIITALIAALGGILIWLYRRADARPVRLDDPMEPSPLRIYVLGLALALAATLPYMRPFLAQGHDLVFHLSRIEGIADGLKSGQFPVRISPGTDGGFGYADASMYPNLFLYLPALLRLLGVSQMNAYIIFIFLINLATALIAHYAFSRLLLSQAGGVMAAALYTFSLYRLSTLYTRAALAGLLAMAFLPLVLAGLYDVFFGDPQKSGALVAGMWGIASSHLLSLSMVLLFAGGFALVFCRRLFSQRRWPALLKAAGLTVALCLWLILPVLAFSRLGFAMPVQADLWKYTYNPVLLFWPLTNTPGDTAALKPMLDASIDSAGILLGVGLLLFLLRGRLCERADTPETRRLTKTGNMFTVIAVLALAMCTPLFPWRALDRVPLVNSYMRSVQFPWRFLMIAGVCLCVVSALALLWVARSNRARRRVAYAVVLVAFLVSLPYFNQTMLTGAREVLLTDKHDRLPALTTQRVLETPDEINGDYRYARDDIAGLWARGAGVTASMPDPVIKSYHKNGTTLRFHYEAAAVSQDDYFEVPLYYYPGYTATLDGGTPLAVQDGGLHALRILLPEGATQGTVTVRYSGLWFYRAGDAVSALTALALCAAAVLRRVKKRKGAVAVG